ncbi:translation initiation factor IF-2 [Candidatus Marinamargulisbacteria bacterium SCGC AG-343-D04]|nr:translation initiation factor IF-2 [Candidatus Marinamargulisbacteria bacterium SCGC AG-343-D04]
MFVSKNVGVKLDPGTTTRVKHLYQNKLNQSEKTTAPLPEKTVSLKEDSIKVSAIPPLFDIPLSGIMKIFLSKGLLVNVNSEIDQETLIEIGKELNVTVEIEDMTSENELGLKTKVMELEETALSEDKDSVESRPPVIAIMGHVDHGKTLLLDKIRQSRVVEGEAGGITQHIGAYQVTSNESVMTFLDTPGHEAFTSLRARGAQVTDIAILVVAADEGIKPQTIEAINHAQVADVPIIVAINKMDKPEADTEKVKQQLSQYNLLAEDWGGETVMVPVSAKTGDGIDSLLEMIHLVSDMQELKAPVSGIAKAVVIESNLSAQKGPIATIIVKAGTLSIGDFFVINGSYGKVRAIINDLGKKIKSLKPGDPGEILGFSEVPEPGSILESKLTEKECKVLVEEFKAQEAAKKPSQKNGCFTRSLILPGRRRQSSRT